MSATLPITDAEFESKILKKDGTFLVDFYADWCGPCKKMTPLLDDLAKKRTDVTIYKVNVDNNPKSAEKYSIRGIPTLLFFKDGDLVKTLVGLQTLSSLSDILSDIQIKKRDS